MRRLAVFLLRTDLARCGRVAGRATSHSLTYPSRFDRTHEYLGSMLWVCRHSVTSAVGGLQRTGLIADYRGCRLHSRCRSTRSRGGGVRVLPHHRRRVRLAAQLTADGSRSSRCSRVKSVPTEGAANGNRASRGRTTVPAGMLVSPALSCSPSSRGQTSSGALCLVSDGTVIASADAATPPAERHGVVAARNTMRQRRGPGRDFTSR